MLTTEQITNFSTYFDYDFTKQLPKGYKKVINTSVFVADLHAPYHHRKYLNQFINETKGYNELIIVGDALDFLSKSHYRKTSTVDFRSEFRQAYYVIQDLCRYYEKVYLMIANHDERYKKWLYDNVPNELLGLLQLNNMVEDLLSLIPNLVICSQKINGGNRNIGFIWQHKNIVFTHIERSYKVLTNVIQEIERDFNKWREHLNLKDYDIVIQAHNHINGFVQYGKKFLHHIPCMINCDEVAFDYVYSGKLQGNPPALGYMTCEMINDKYDPNSIKHISFE